MSWQRPPDGAGQGPEAAGVPSAALSLQQAVEDALQDLINVAGLTHEDSWEHATANPPAAATAPSAATAAARQTSTQHPPRTSGGGSSSSRAMAASGSGLLSPLELAADSGEVVQEQDLPPQAAVRLYQARLRAAQSDLADLQEAAKAKDAKLGGLEKELQQLRLEKAAWQKQQKVLEAQAERSKRAAEEARARLQEQENALRQMGLERRASQQERRQSEADIKAREGKLTAALEEAQRLRRLLEEARAAAAARQGVSREEHARVVAENRQLVAQKQELVVAFKKASKLIDVLRRQKVHLEAAALLQVSSRELAEALQQ